MELSEKAGVLGRPRASADYNDTERDKTNIWRKMNTDHQRWHYYEHCSRSIVPQEFSVSGTRRSTLSNPELAAFVLALRDTLIEEPLLYYCDNQSLLKEVNRWIGRGGKATLVGAPDADILAAAIEILRKRIIAGTAACS